MTPLPIGCKPFLPAGLRARVYTCETPPHADFLKRYRESHLGGEGETPARKRLIEFWLARSAAQDLVGETDPEARSVKIGQGKEGEPLFPAGFVGSLSHTGREGAQFGAALLGPAIDFEGVAIDIESIDRPMKGDLRSLADKIAHPEEAQWIFEASERDEIAKRFFIVFSAKECAFKALYVRYGAPVRFTDVQVRGDGAGSFTLSFLVPVGTRFAAGDSVPLTLCELPEHRLTGTIIAIPQVPS